jgi:hypothetical protein
LYGYISSFGVAKGYSRGGKLAIQLQLTLIRTPDDEASITIEFYNVHELNIANFDGYGPSAVHIVNIAADGLEELNFRIADSEQATFSFSCASYAFNDDISQATINNFQTLL